MGIHQVLEELPSLLLLFVQNESLYYVTSSINTESITFYVLQNFVANAYVFLI